MTERKIVIRLKRIEQCKTNKYPMEALLSAYHLNIELLKFIILKTSPALTTDGKKIKSIIKEVQNESSINPVLKGVINKQSLKSIKLWLEKMDLYFKTLKFQQPLYSNILLSETEKICAILMISTKKLLVKE